MQFIVSFILVFIIIIIGAFLISLLSQVLLVLEYKLIVEEKPFKQCIKEILKNA